MNLKKAFRIVKAFSSYFLEVNITKEKKFEIIPATIQDRIQNEKKTDLSAQFIQARVKVIKKVVIKFFKNFKNRFRK